MRAWAIIAMGFVWLAACGGAVVTTAGPFDPVASESALIERVVSEASGMRPGLRGVRVHAASDGSRIACGDWTAPDGIGTTDWAPFYIRWRGEALLRVHLDDATGFGPAILGCNQAEEGKLRISG